MKRILSMLAALVLVFAMILPASAQEITDVTVDFDKNIATGVLVGDQPFTVSATFTPSAPGGRLGEGIAIYYQNGDCTPPQSFIRFVMWRDNGSDAGADRIDFYCEKQYADKNVGTVPAGINGLAANDPANNAEYRYISVDWGWYASTDVAFKMDVSVDPATQTATATLMGIPSNQKATLVVYLTEKAIGEQTAGELTWGEVFVWKNNCAFSNFNVVGANGEEPIPSTTTGAPTTTTTAPIIAPVTTQPPANPDLVTMAGVLKDTAGNAVPNAILIVDKSDGKQANCMTDANGNFELKNIPEGGTMLTVRDENGNVMAASNFYLASGSAASVATDGSRVTAADGAIGLTLTMDASTYSLTMALNG